MVQPPSYKDNGMPEMTAEQAAEWERSPSFRVVWEILQEVGRKQAEAAEQMKIVEQKQAEAAEQIRKMSAETDRELEKTAEQIRKMSAKTDRELEKTARQIRDLSVNIGGVNSTLGKWSEEMVAAKLCEKINPFGYEFTRCARNIKYWENGERIAEVDCFLENGGFVMPVETKTDLTTSKIDKYIEKINRIRRYMDNHNDKRTIVGAVAGAVVPESVCRYAQKKGLYVLVQSGESITAAEAPEDFKPRKWENA